MQKDTDGHAAPGHAGPRCHGSGGLFTTSPPSCDLVWLIGIAGEMCEDLRGRKLRVWRHVRRPVCWIDGGAGHSWMPILNPGQSRILRTRPESDDGWRRWGGKRTDGAELLGGDVLGGDRVLILRLRWRSRVGDEERTDLVLECGGRQTNAVLLSPDGIVLEVLRPVSARVSRVRQVLPGRSYQPPPTLDRQRIDEPWDWARLGDGRVGETFVRRFLAMSARWARELCLRCGIEGGTLISTLHQSDREALERTAVEMVHQPTPHLIMDEAGEPIDHLGFRPSDLPLERVRVVETFADAAELVWTERRRRAADPGKPEDQDRGRARQRRRLERKLRNLAEDLRQAECADELARRADLIMSHLVSIPDRAAQVTVVDWLDPDGNETTVSLDPTRPPAKQAERLYRRARKLRKSVPHIERRIAETKRAAEELERSMADEPADPTRTTRRLPGNGVTPPHEKPDKTSRGPRDEIRPRRYRTRDGNWLVLVGRNDRENDILSLKVAARDDYWFHAYGSAGSHVVLRREGRKDAPSRRALAEVAALAAYWSKQRGGSKVGVSYTLAKHVTKPRGAKPGTVVIRQEKLLTVPPSLLPLADDRSASDSGEAQT